MAPLVKRPKPKAWQFQAVAVVGIVAFGVIWKPSWDQFWREKATSMAEKKDI